MNHSLAMGISNGVSDFTQQLEPLVGCQLVTVGSKVVIETNRLRVGVPKQQAWTEFVIFVIEYRKNTGVVEALNYLKFASCGPLDPFPLIFGPPD